VNEQKFNVEVVRTNGTYDLIVNGKQFTVDAVRPAHQAVSLIVDGHSYEVGLEKKENQYSIYFFNDSVELELYEARKYKAAELTKKASVSGPMKIMAPMPGKIVKLLVSENMQVNEGDSLLVIEAMKMQNELKAPRTGIIRQIQTSAGQPVTPQQTLMVLE